MSKIEDKLTKLKSIGDRDSDASYFSAQARYSKAMRQSIFRNKILPSILQSGYEVSEFQEDSFRIKKGGIVIDFYPGARKCFDKRKDKGWLVTNDILKTLSKIFVETKD